MIPVTWVLQGMICLIFSLHSRFGYFENGGFVVMCNNHSRFKKKGKKCDIYKSVPRKIICIWLNHRIIESIFWYYKCTHILIHHIYWLTKYASYVKHEVKIFSVGQTFRWKGRRVNRLKGTTFTFFIDLNNS